MTDNYCPACDAPLDSSAINIAEGAALCETCGELSRLAKVLAYRDDRELLTGAIRETPAGCRLSRRGGEVTLEASQASFANFLGALCVCLFWNGIVSVFVLIALGGLYQHFVGPLPDWFPAPAPEPKQGLGMTLFLCVFLTPFVAIGAVLAAVTLMCAFGRVRVEVEPHQGVVLTGIGPFNWPQRFQPAKVRSVETGKSSWTENDEHREQIKLVADRTHQFAAYLPQERRDWLRAMLHELLVAKNPARVSEIFTAARDARRLEPT